MRRSTARRQKRIVTKRSIFWLVFAVFVAISLWYLTFVSRFIRRTAIPSRRIKEEATFGCTGWRQTRSCTPYGVRDFGGDKDCQARISRSSGYCECEQHLTIKRMSCGGYRAFTCEDACNELGSDLSQAVPLPANISCPGTRDNGLMGAAAGWLHQKSIGNSKHISSHARSNNGDLDAHSYDLWKQIWEASHAAANGDLRLPEARTIDRDWVRDGVHIPRPDILAIRSQWQSFMRDVPSFPRDLFNGKGVVILAGGLTYLVPAWVNVHMLRQTGCTLPVEMFFPREEFPTPLLEAALAGLGVTSRELPSLGAPALRRETPEDAAPGGDLSGFTLKIATLLLSRFREVIFLDSDNVPVADPSSLFEDEEYLRTGALLWPDYWQSSAAPDLAAILDVRQLPSGTFESGQMVFDKSRAWDGLVLAAFFNLKSDLYYELFSNYMGKGDKESLAHALQAVSRPFSVVNVPVGTVGEFVWQCNGKCRLAFLGNTMTQHSPSGQVMFLHTNLSPKWNLELPANFLDYRRRWKVTILPANAPAKSISFWFVKQVILPGGADFLETFGELERDIYDILVAFRCAHFLPAYVEAMSSPGDYSKEAILGLKGFHPQNPGIDFREAFRWGIAGPYLNFAQVSIRDRLTHWQNTVFMPWSRFMWRMTVSCTKLFTKDKPYFVLRSVI